MSLFKHQDIDKVLLSYLSFDDAVLLSQVNKYYYKSTKNILKQLRDFNKVKSTLSIEIPLHDVHLIITSKYLETYDPTLKTIIQAYIYGDLDVIKYITKHNKQITLFEKLNVAISNDMVTQTKTRYIDTILVNIAIYKTRLDILTFIGNIYSFDDLILAYSYGANGPYHYDHKINYEISSILQEYGF